MRLRHVATALPIAGIITAQIAFGQVRLNFVNADIVQMAKAIGAATGKTIIVGPRVKALILKRTGSPQTTRLAGSRDHRSFA